VLQVIEERDLSDAAAQRLGVPHASPQAFVIRQGHCVWHASHHDITTNALDQQAR
jgi:bacillithiol system protein YtxJ